MRNEMVFGPQGAHPPIFDGPDGAHIGYLVPLAGIVPKDVYEAPDFDAYAYAEDLRPGVHAEVEAERREVLESLEDQGILDPAALGGS